MCDICVKTVCNSVVRMDMRGSGNPAQTKLTAGGQTANQFDLQRKEHEFWAHGGHGPKTAAGRRASAAAGQQDLGLHTDLVR